MPHKNWQAICGIKDDLFRLLVATTKDEYILAGLNAGFPELFSSEGPTQLRVPASALREAARTLSIAEWGDDRYAAFDSEFMWPCNKFGIPQFRWEEGHDDVPKELLQQLVGQRFEAGLSVEYRGIRCLVVGISDTTAKLHETIAEVPETTFLYLVPADCVYLDSPKTLKRLFDALGFSQDTPVTRETIHQLEAEALRKHMRRADDVP